MTPHRPLIVGIVNITADSFSDGGRFLNSAAAIAHARRLAPDADIVELGAAASNIAAQPVMPEEEIARLQPVMAELAAAGTAISIDAFQLATQRYALGCGVGYLNDIRGFPDAAIYPDLAAARCKLVVMHSVQGEARATRVDLTSDAVWDHIEAFFDERVARLARSGIGRDRLILDPGMGFFLSSRADASLAVLAGLGRLKQRFRLPVMVSVSRKSFLGAVTERDSPDARGAATLAAELYAAARGADYIRTHDPAALRDGLAVVASLAAAECDVPPPHSKA